MRRASAVLLLLVMLIGGATTAVAPAASAQTVTFDACGLVGKVVPPGEDDCRATTAFVRDTVNRQADNVFFVFCTIFPTHPACP